VNRWLLWLLLSSLTGSPVGSLIFLLALWWLSDRVTFRFLPDPVRAAARWRRRGQLRRNLAANPHDRRARYELAELLLEGGWPDEAAAVLLPNAEAGDDDVHTAFTMGAALARSRGGGQAERAERVLAVAREAEPGFRLGAIDLELGRLRLRRGDFAGAREALERFVAARPGTVEGRFHLARALAGLGDGAGAARARREAWEAYAQLPRFRRREERPFAWRARPWRPLAVALALLAAGALSARWVVPALVDRAGESRAADDPAADR
jgi:predicted Zn-dependent protease